MVRKKSKKTTKKKSSKSTKKSVDERYYELKLEQEKLEMKQKAERTKRRKSGNSQIIWGLCFIVFLGWTIIFGIIGIVLLLSGIHDRMKASEDM